MFLKKIKADNQRDKPYNKTDRKKSKTSSSGRSSNYTKEELANLKKYAPQAYRQVMKITQKQKQLQNK